LKWVSFGQRAGQLAVGRRRLVPSGFADRRGWVEGVSAFSFRSGEERHRRRRFLLVTRFERVRLLRRLAVDAAANRQLLRVADLLPRHDGPIGQNVSIDFPRPVAVGELSSRAETSFKHA